VIRTRLGARPAVECWSVILPFAMRPKEDKLLDYATPAPRKRSPVGLLIAVAIFVFAALGLALLLTPDGLTGSKFLAPLDFGA